jgi:uncharacterized protein (TIGR03663 family)
MTRTALVVAVVVAAGAGLALRWPGLTRRPMHGDEAVHAYKFNELWTTGRYDYDPFEYHGPTLYYLTFPAVWLSGARDFGQTTEATFRRVPVVMGVGLILLVLLVADGLGRAAAACAAVLTAFSPALTFYSRYYIQETLLVFFTFLVLAAGWRYVRTRKLGWALLAGAGVGLMHATKETCVIPMAALLGAALLSALWTRRVDRRAMGLSDVLRPWPLVGAVAASCVVSAVLFSGFFTNPSGPWNSLRTFATYFARAGGGVHEHPWYYYLEMLLYSHTGRAPVWTEALIVVLAAVAAVAALLPGQSGAEYKGLLRFVTFYTLLMTAVYSLIPYKTPWCALGFLHGTVLMAGAGGAALLKWLTRPAARVLVGVALLCGTGHLAWQARQLTTRFEVSQRNPYVYAHPLAGVVQLGDYVGRLAAAAPAGHRLLVKVLADNCWPLPWYLRRMERVGYWETVPDDPDADVVIVSQGLRAALEEKLRGDYRADPYGLRPDEMLFVYVKRELRAEFERQARSRATPATTRAVP